MKVSLNWVKDFTKISLTPDELRERISVSLTEVENMEPFGERFTGIIVAEVEEVTTHPITDGLLVLKLDTGQRHVAVVVQRCSVAVKDKVPYMPPGTVIPAEIGMKRTKNKVDVVQVKGVKSDGMVPSGRELGLNYDHTTVYQLPKDAAVGSPLSQILDLTDQIMEFKNKALTHRPDTFSIEGMAREIAAIQGTSYQPLPWLTKYNKDIWHEKKSRLPIKVVNNAKALCPRYMAVVLDDVTVRPSPDWMQIRLAKHDIRPVNNVVDISNYLMLEAGQPSHTFDYDRIVEKDLNFKGTAVITIRMAQGGETITTLDGQQKELYDDTIIISDSQNPIGVAGVMGGKDTEILDTTKRVIFQVENLDMYAVRRTSMKLGILSDAVTRFSRGLDPNRCEPVLYQGIELLKKYAGAQVASSVTDTYVSPQRSHSISFAPDLSRLRIGAPISDRVILAIFKRLGLETTVDKKSHLFSVVIPSFRRDLSIPEDLDEEIVRIFGYDRITPTLPVRTISPVPKSEFRMFRSSIKEVLAAAGAHEAYTYSFVGPDLYDWCGLSLDGGYLLIIPVSPELSFMRPLIVPSLLEKIPQNLVLQPTCALFEIDMVNPIEEHGRTNGELPVEPWHLGFVITKDYYFAKYYLEEALSRVHVNSFELISSDKIERGVLPPWVQYADQTYNHARMAYVRVNATIVGVIGEIRKSTAALLKISTDVCAFDIRLDDVLPSMSDVPAYRDPSRYPAVVHDLCFILDSDVPYRALFDTISGVDPKRDVIKDIVCRDIYQERQTSDNSQPSKKITVRVTMQSDVKTLHDSDIEKLRLDIVEAVRRQIKAELCA